LFSGLVMSHIVTSEVDRTAQELRTIAEASLVDLPADDAAARAAVERRLQESQRQHPGLTYTLWRHGRALGPGAGASTSLPSWVQPPGYAGIGRESEEEETPALRTVVLRNDAALLLQLPVDASLFSSLEPRMGIHYVAGGGTVRHDKRGVHIRMDPAARAQVRAAEQSSAGISFPAAPDRRRWSDGLAEPGPRLVL